MAHPFFDVPRYPWHRAEATRLHKILFTAITVPSRIDLLYKNCSADSQPLSLGLPPDVIWKEVLENLAIRGALRRLCEAILDMQEFKNETGQIVIQEVLNAQTATNLRIFSNDVLLLDRVNLRDQVRLLEPEETTVKVLLVRGGPRSGKSHSRLLFERAAQDKGALAVYVCDGIVVTVEDVIMQLFSALEASEKIPPRSTTEDAWYRTVCFKLQEVASAKGRQLWIAVDDLGSGQDGAPLLDTSIRRFCEQFALNMMSPAFRQWFRLMLIHYPDGPVPTKWKRDIWCEDRTSDADVQEKHIVELLRTWSVDHNQKIIEDELIVLASNIIAKAESPPTTGEHEAARLQHIHDQLIETLKSLTVRSP